MPSIKSSIRNLVKPILFKLLGNKFYKYAQFFGKKRDIQYKLVEEREMFLLPTFIKEGDTVLDLGANFAYFTERMSKLVGSTGKVIAFEPIPFTFEVFTMIVKHFKLKNVEYHQKGVSDKTETVKFNVPKMDFGTLSTGQAHIAKRNNDSTINQDYTKYNAEAYFDCQVVKLDEFYNNNIEKLTFIKIDIEGAELHALKGASNIIKKNRPVILIEINPVFLQGFSISENDIRQFVDDLDYEILYINEETGKLEFLNSKSFWEFNFIFIPEEKISLYKNYIANA